MVDTEQVEQAALDLATHGQEMMAKYLAILLIMKADDGVDNDGKYAWERSKFEHDLITAYKRSYKLSSVVDRCVVYADYFNIFKKHADVIDDIDAYIETM